MGTRPFKFLFSQHSALALAWLSIPDAAQSSAGLQAFRGAGTQPSGRPGLGPGGLREILRGRQCETGGREGERGPDLAERGRAEPRRPRGPLLPPGGNSAATSQPLRPAARRQFACAATLARPPRWRPRLCPQMGGGRGAGGAAARESEVEPPPQASPTGIPGRSRRPVQPGFPCPRGALRASPAGAAPPRQVGGAAQREACASARVRVCFGGVCAGAAPAGACPVSANRCPGAHPAGGGGRR